MMMMIQVTISQQRIIPFAVYMHIDVTDHTLSSVSNL